MKFKLTEALAEKTNITGIRLPQYFKLGYSWIWSIFDEADNLMIFYKNNDDMIFYVWKLTPSGEVFDRIIDMNPYRSILDLRLIKNGYSLEEGE